jgi:tRNA (cytidine/uridine-2'-O-)-methyltransferase
MAPTQTARPGKLGQTPGLPPPSPGDRSRAAIARQSPRQIAGAWRIDEALRAGDPIGLVLIHRDAADPAARAVAGRAAQAGIRVRRVTAGVLRRLSRGSVPDEILALAGPPPATDLREVLARPGAIWLLAGLSYPSNAGAAIRTAEVSGAGAVIIDGPFNNAARRAALRFSVRGDWFMPVLWHDAHAVLDAAEATARPVIGVELTGTRAPWEIDLTADPLFVVGGETDGIPTHVLDRCPQTIRIPMRGFIPSYNLQAAMAAIAVERLRQLGESP